MNTIDYLSSFNNINELLNIYEQHLNSIIEGGNISGNMLSFEEENIDENHYNINTLYLRVLIPKDLIKENKVPAKRLLISSNEIIN